MPFRSPAVSLGEPVLGPLQTRTVCRRMRECQPVLATRPTSPASAPPQTLTVLTSQVVFRDLVMQLSSFILHMWSVM